MKTLIVIGILIYLYGGYAALKLKFTYTNLFQDLCRVLFFIASFFGGVVLWILVIELIIKYLP